MAKTPILKERLFGLTNNQGNHGEDVKELFLKFQLPHIPTINTYTNTLKMNSHTELESKRKQRRN
jgi:hypothetical protein